MQMQAVAFVPEMSYFAAPEGRIFVDQLTLTAAIPLLSSKSFMQK
jgi:hypothetical protein